MSQENLEIVRRVFARFQHGNFSVAEFVDSDVHIKWLDGVGTESETVGLQAASNFMKNWFEDFDNLSLVAERFIDAGDRVVVICAWRGRGKTSGVETEWRHAEVWSLRDGRAASVIAYPDPRDALEAVGLRE